MEYGYDDEILLLAGDWGHKTVTERLNDYLSSVSDGREVSILIISRNEKALRFLSSMTHADYTL